MINQIFLTIGILTALLSGCGPARHNAPPAVDLDYDLEVLVGEDSGRAGEFFPGATHDPSITTPEALIGHPVGARVVSHEKIIAAFERWAEESPRVEIATYAKSHEGRRLVRVVISSPENLSRIGEIKAAIARLADPRGLSTSERDRIVKKTPAVAWLGFSIHGNELSGADASLAVGHHLIAGKGEDVTGLLERLVIVIDPVMNPDGRERTMSFIAQSAGEMPNLDYASMHRGRWPWGRGNHYLFDMNRDWIVGVAPETRGRWQQLLEFHPQLVVDVHEMWALDNFLFYPANEPINPARSPHVMKWQKVFAANHAAAFDALGWSYYTREWVDGWYPGYSDGWSSLNGAVGMLYEQARYHGQSLKKPTGKVVRYEQAVRAQAVSCLSDLLTLAANREGVLEDYALSREKALDPEPRRAFVLRPGRYPDRERAFLEALLRQGIEIQVTGDELGARSARGPFGPSEQTEIFPSGSYLIPESQPQGTLLRVLLMLDPRLPKDVLRKEREKLERENQSNIYDVTSWDLVHAFDLDGFWIEQPRVDTKPLTELPPWSGRVVPPAEGTAYAWIVDGRDDASLTFAVQAIERGVAVRVAEKPFSSAGRPFTRGSLLVRRQDNEPDVEKKIAEAAKKAGVQVFATATGRSPDDGPDLGAPRFELLSRPRVAVLVNWPVWPSDYGHVWHLLDRELEIPFTLLDIQMLHRYDLRRYNVLVVPTGHKTLGAMLAPHAAKLSAWTRGGGTLIAVGSAAAALTGEAFDLGTVTLRRSVLAELAGYEEAAAREIASRAIEIDEAAIWDGTKKETEEKKSEEKKGEDKAVKSTGGGGGGDEAKKEAERQDAWKRRFAPKGAVLRGLVNSDSWLTYGCRNELPVILAGDFAFVSRFPAVTPVRLADADELRLAGLLWPEARERLATTAYATTERLDAGQVIFFAWSPYFRAYWKGSGRLLANAIVYGPSLGASQPHVW